MLRISGFKDLDSRNQ